MVTCLTHGDSIGEWGGWGFRCQGLGVGVSGEVGS